ncbi:MAG: MBL fold metallo-hydrolase [Bacilli bacterium]
MQITCLIVGPLQTNCYLLEKDNEVLIIDPGDDFSKIDNAVKDKKVVGCLLTHSHFDHVGALEEVLNKYHLNVNSYKGNTFKYETLRTKGHTDDSITFYFKEEKVMFCGDFIFYHSIGRTDIGGNTIDMKKSLEMISSYPNDITIYPGHGISTNLGEEKKRFSLYY